MATWSRSTAFRPLNGVKQGCPLSPLLYILSLQPLLALLESDTDLHGIPIPGDHGEGSDEARVSAYADDLLLALRGYADLPAAWRCIDPYLVASGAAVNWGKTIGLRCGPLRRPGHAGATCNWPTPPGAERMRGIQYVDVDSPDASRYLGVYLGSDAAVQNAWLTRIAAGITQRILCLRAAGIPATWYGRTTVAKTLVFAIANFAVMNQMPSNWHTLIANWEDELAELLWSTRAGDDRAFHGMPRASPWMVRREAAIQDHGDGGMRALDPRRFSAALRATWIRLLLDPAPQQWKNIVWEYVRAIPSVRALGVHEQAFTSALTFTDIPTRFPPLFRAAMRAWAELTTLRPTEAAMGRALEYEQVAAFSPYYNRAALADQRLASTARRQYGKPTDAADTAARVTHDGALRVALQAGLTTVGSLTRGAAPLVAVVQAPAGGLKAEITAAARAQLRRTTCQLLAAYVREWPQPWLAALARGAQPLAPGDWVYYLDAGGRQVVGRYTATHAAGYTTLRRFRVDRTCRLHDAHRTAVHDTARRSDGPLVRALVWQGPRSSRDERVEDALRRGHVVDGDLQAPRLVWRLQGALGAGHIDPSAWELRGRATLRAPRVTELSRVRNRSEKDLLKMDLDATLAAFGVRRPPLGPARLCCSSPPSLLA